MVSKNDGCLFDIFCFVSVQDVDPTFQHLAVQYFCWKEYFVEDVKWR